MPSDPQHLRDIVKFNLYEHLTPNRFSWRQEIVNVVCEIIDWADSAGKVEQLIEAAHTANGNNLRIRSR
jgi:hypothetical protein